MKVLIEWLLVNTR